jgi:FixJ family two-component response regulator
MDGLELQRRLRTSQSEIPVIFITAHDDVGTRRRAVDGGAVDFLSKPFNANTLMATIEAAIG